MRRGFDRGAGLGLAVDARREPVGALPFERTIDPHRAVDAVAAAIQRNSPGPFHITPDIAIGVDLPEQHPAMHAFDLFVDTGESLRDIPLDIGCKGRQAEFDPC